LTITKRRRVGKFNIKLASFLLFSSLGRHPKLPAKNGIVNKAGLTPLTLACKLGRSEVFREMLELSCREFWRYSNITCSAYPLNALDTLMPDGSTSKDAKARRNIEN
jgi:transient receptor potential cation channel subfamily V member 6